MGAMLVYSCPVIMYTLYVALYMKTTDTTGLEHRLQISTQSARQLSGSLTQ